MKILSIGGSIIIPKTGFDIPFLQSLRSLLLEHIAFGERFIITIGGGATSRSYQSAAQAVRPLSNDDLDWIGIAATKMNAEFVRFLLKEDAYEKVMTLPTKKIKTKKPLIIAAGWKPGCSTDHDAVLLAKTYGTKHIINVSNISYVYDKDPNAYADAKKIESIDWKTFRRDIVGDRWEPGKSAPFDPIASKLAERLRLTVAIVNGSDLSELDKAIRGEAFRGTVIHP